MPSYFVLFAPFALLLPLGLFGAPGAEQDGRGQVANQSDENDRRVSPLPLSPDAPGYRRLQVDSDEISRPTW
jgi:hypothetical protein